MASDAEQAFFVRWAGLTPSAESCAQFKTELTALLRSREEAAYREGQERMRERLLSGIGATRVVHIDVIRAFPIEDKEE